MPATAAAPARAAAVPAPDGRAYFPAFDGLRGIAAMLVVVVHTTLASGFTGRSWLGAYTARGEIGVAVFFLISGFLLYRPFAVAHLTGGAAPGARGFLVRRALRIVPLYWVALAVLLLVNGWHSVHGVAGLAQTALFAQVYSKGWALQGITQAWTLCIEVVFYLTLPAYALLLGRRRRAPGRQLRVELAALAVLYALGVAFHWYVLAHPSGATDAWHGWLPTWGDMFALGMGLAVVSAWYAGRGRHPRWTLLPGSAAACWALAAVTFWVVSTRVGLRRDPLYVGPVRTELGHHALYGLFALLLLLPAVLGPPGRGPVRRFLASRPMAFLGLVSYGVYLWHQLVILQLVRRTGWELFRIPVVPFFLVVTAVTVALSALTYRLVERPFVALGHSWARRRRERQAGLSAT